MRTEINPPTLAEIRAKLDGYIASGLLHYAIPVGSRATCDPPPTDTDQDYLCLLTGEGAVFNDDGSFYAAAGRDGFTCRASYFGDRYDRPLRFQSYRLGDANLIVTEDRNFARLFLAASSLAKRLNVMAKRDRIALFHAVLFGDDCGGIVPASEGGAA